MEMDKTTCIEIDVFVCHSFVRQKDLHSVAMSVKDKYNLASLCFVSSFSKNSNNLLIENLLK